VDSSAPARSQYFPFFLSRLFSPLSQREPSTASALVSIVTLSPTLAQHNQVSGIGVGVGAETRNWESVEGIAKMRMIGKTGKQRKIKGAYNA